MTRPIAQPIALAVLIFGWGCGSHEIARQAARGRVASAAAIALDVMLEHDPSYAPSCDPLVDCGSPACDAKLCASVNPDPGDSDGGVSECARDEDCGSGFCDRGSCATPSGAYGLQCDPRDNLIAPDGTRDGYLSPICRGGIYFCIANRCRSCGSDLECTTEFVGGRCSVDSIVPGQPTFPGRRCGG
jgi:hypothetical protein